MSRVKSLGHGLEKSEMLDKQSLFIERVALELRTNKGLSQRWWNGLDQQKLGMYLESGVLVQSQNCIKIVPEKNAFVDHIVSELI